MINRLTMEFNICLNILGYIFFNEFYFRFICLFKLFQSLILYLLIMCTLLFILYLCIL